jgi:hypothetical protein
MVAVSQVVKAVCYTEDIHRNDVSEDRMKTISLELIRVVFISQSYRSHLCFSTLIHPL